MLTGQQLLSALMLGVCCRFPNLDLGVESPYHLELMSQGGWWGEGSVESPREEPPRYAQSGIKRHQDPVSELSCLCGWTGAAEVEGFPLTPMLNKNT